MDNKSETDVNVHANHRKRVKESFLKDGLDAFNDHQVLEMLLFYSIPRYDTNEIAHALMDEFGSLSAVFDAELPALTAVPGIGSESALLIKFFSQLYRRYCIDRQRDVKALPGCASAAEYLVPFFMGENEEKFIAVLVDAVFNIRKVSVIDTGNEDSVFVNVNRVMKEVINSHCSGVILAHSHPNGFPYPSHDDRAVTIALAEKLKAVNVRLCEHIIVSRNEVYYMSQEKNVSAENIFVFNAPEYFDR